MKPIQIPFSLFQTRSRTSPRNSRRRMVKMKIPSLLAVGFPRLSTKISFLLAVSLLLIPVGWVTAQTFTTLHSFTGGSDGARPDAGLILSGNTLYGTTAGNYYGYGTVFAVNTDGTGFRFLHNFTDNEGGGDTPVAGLVLSGNTLYGTAGGSVYRGVLGTVFAVNTDGTGFTILHSFTYGSDGAFPSAGLILSGNTLYGTAYGGGTTNNGTVFSLPTLAPPVITSANNTMFTVGSNGSFTVTTTGIPTPTLSESGTLPSGVTFNTATGVLSGTPAAGTAGVYPITFTASNGVPPDAIQSFTLTVSTVTQAPAITSPN